MPQSDLTVIPNPLHSAPASELPAPLKSASPRDLSLPDALATARGTTLVHCNGGTRAAVAVAVVLAERAGQGAKEARAALDGAGFDISGRPYERFIENYFKK